MGGVKIRMDLKPDTLSHDANPMEVRKWIQDFQAYFDASMLILESRRGQRTALFKNLDRTLEAHVRQQSDEDTPVFEEPRDDDLEDGPPSCIEYVLEYFSKTYPMAARRIDLLRIRQDRAEPRRAYLRRIQNLADECDLAEITQEDLMILISINGAETEEDRRSMRKVTDKDPAVRWLKLIDNADDHDQANLEEEREQKLDKARQAREQPGRSQGQRQGQGQGRDNRKFKKQDRQRRGNSSNRSTPSKQACYRCGSAEHFSASCTYPKDVPDTATTRDI